MGRNSSITRRIRAAKPRPPANGPDRTLRPEIRSARTVCEADDLTLALHAVLDFGRWIRNADGKAALLAGVHGFILTGALSQAMQIRATLRGEGNLANAAFVVFAILAAAVLVSLGYLLATQLPRLSPPQGGSRLAFPTAAVLAHRTLASRTTVADRRDEAWREAASLARIALAKYRLLRRAMLAGFVAVLAFVTWSFLATLMVV
jgi:hypothetical protein